MTTAAEISVRPDDPGYAAQMEARTTGHYKVRVVFPGGTIIHLASRDEPQPQPSAAGTWWTADWIEGTPYGDTIGVLNFYEAIAVTWRWAKGTSTPRQSAVWTPPGDVTSRIITALKMQDGQTSTQLADATGYKKATISAALGQLKDAGRVWCELDRSDRHWSWHLTAKLLERTREREVAKDAAYQARQAITDAAYLDCATDWATCGQVAGKLGVSPPAAGYRLRKLVGEGHLEQRETSGTVTDPDGKSVGAKPGPKMYKAVPQGAMT